MTTFNQLLTLSRTDIFIHPIYLGFFIHCFAAPTSDSATGEDWAATAECLVGARLSTLLTQARSCCPYLAPPNQRSGSPVVSTSFSDRLTIKTVATDT
ncbi:hypothetical protein [Fischerella sp. PCC 9605]|uniref:hypothetical protein n=1 Tax=Fischerella sp. PCC 9605 TaxID=1173024 RepID=UPI0018CC6BFA|nr:hypothetical protein [Fischerella sp. PCC 9605]